MLRGGLHCHSPLRKCKGGVIVPIKERRTSKKTSTEEKRDARAESLSIGPDRCAMGGVGTSDPSGSRRCHQCGLLAARNRERDSLRLAERLSVEMGAA